MVNMLHKAYFMWCYHDVRAEPFWRWDWIWRTPKMGL